jgi:FtsP/CotA-like multicopper oxidase with cupredoxin domain
MRPGETQLWRLVNAGADIAYQLQLDGHHFTVINQDGRPVAGVTSSSTLLMPPGKRYDVLVTAGRQPGQTWLRTTAYSNGPQGDSYPDTPLARITVAGTPGAALPPVSGAIRPAPGTVPSSDCSFQRSSSRGRTTSRTINCRAAARGMATRAPMMPSRAPPRSTATTVATGDN